MKELIADEEELNELMFDQLQGENSINLIYLHSQLMAERGRSSYFRSLIEAKNRGDRYVESDSSKTEFCGFDEKEKENSMDFLHRRLVSEYSISENDDDLWENIEGISRYSEREFEEKYQNEYKEIQTSLNLTQQRNKQLRKSVKHTTGTIEKLEESNEMLRELAYTLEKKIVCREKEIFDLDSELENLQNILDKLQSAHGTCEEALDEKTYEITGLHNTIQYLNAQVKSLSASLESQKALEIQKSFESASQISRLELEKKTFSDQVSLQNAEVNKLKEKIYEQEENFRISKEFFEREKTQIITRLKLEKDEISLKLKDAYDLVEIHNTNTLDSSNNELCELDEISHDRTIEVPLKRDSLSLYKNSLLQYQIDILTTENLALRSQLENPEKSSGKNQEIQVNFQEDFESKDSKSRKSNRSHFLFWNKANPIVNRLFL